MEKRFLVINRDSKVVEIAASMQGITGDNVYAHAPFSIAVGCINEFGQAEVVGVIAESYGLDWNAKTAYVTSETDGARRLVGLTGGGFDLVWKRLHIMECNGRFDDLANLPSPVIVIPVRKALSASK